MKNALYFGLILFILLSCKGEDEPSEPVDPTITGLKVNLDKKAVDKNDPLYKILSGYYEYAATPVDYFSTQIPCNTKHIALSKAWISRKDDKTLFIHFVYIGYCTTIQGPRTSNDYEFVAGFNATAPSLPLSVNTRLDLTGVCTLLKPTDNQLLNQKVTGYAYLSPTLGEFVINLPSVKGVAQQIKAKMDVREFL